MKQSKEIPQLTLEIIAVILIAIVFSWTEQLFWFSFILHFVSLFVIYQFFKRVIYRHLLNYLKK